MKEIDIYDLDEAFKNGEIWKIMGNLKMHKSRGWVKYSERQNTKNIFLKKKSILQLVRVDSQYEYIPMR